MLRIYGSDDSSTAEGASYAVENWAAAGFWKELIAGLFAAYRDDPARLPDEWRASLPEADPARSRHIGDFIAGMTDRYAIARYREVVGPVEMPEGF